MSRLSRYLREHNTLRHNAWLYLLLFGSRTCNAAFLLVGMAMIAYAGDLYATQPGTGSGGPAWPSGPPPASTVVFATMGLAAALGAAAALAATFRHSLFLLNVHLGLLALLMAAQVCLAAAVAAYDNGGGESGTVVPDIGTRRGWRPSFRGGGGGGGSGAVIGVLLSTGTAAHGGSGIGGGGTGGGGGGGGGNSVLGELSDALMAYKWADAVTVVVEVVTLLVGCLLHSAYMRTDQRAEDMEEGLLPDSAAPLLTSRRREVQQQQHGGGSGRRAQLPPRVVRDDPWSRRMREQYGIDTSMLSYDPAAAQQGAGSSQAAAAAPVEPGPRSRCVIS
ncbi:hypothetical protein PLESTB_000155000 [Pleodorina starrii]|uniref:Uncharacterized protein n=1 Tax=Pleodorina starrii TaxID=330485 RepID=A0A9W6BBS5_9CHLO|nr:hypothetical protein PLESTM_000453700 [Pleodorina starrii]GLC48848.1 hypothetical protein PLESTB_000155000 [Pleodorina starrii]